jgi:hypothetical protein
MEKSAYWQFYKNKFVVDLITTDPQFCSKDEIVFFAKNDATMVNKNNEMASDFQKELAIQLLSIKTKGGQYLNRVKFVPTGVCIVFRTMITAAQDWEVIREPIEQIILARVLDLEFKTG